MARITIDGTEYEVHDGDNLLAVALALGIDLPYFCWHPALGSVGACRQCAATQYKDEKDARGRLVMACMTPVSDGARFSVNDKAARDFRASVIEWLMLNHPHDCPVCDEGGECHLQDMTVMTGHIYRRSHSPKRTFRSQDLGPFVTHEMNRCITCYRCVRFYNDYAGGSDLHAFASKNHVYFGRHEDGVLESPFSGNLVEVCPTGVFTDKTLAQHYVRKWDLQSAPTVCVHCGVGCNTFTAERYGTVRRVINRFHSEINGYFLCDRGRFGYPFNDAQERLPLPLARKSDGERGARTGDATVAGLRALFDGKTIYGIGSPRASFESNYALRRMVGSERFSSGMGAKAQRTAERSVAALRSVNGWSLKEVESCDAVVVLGEDVESTNPRLSLAIRQSLRTEAFAHATELEIPHWQDLSVREASPRLHGLLYVLSPLPTALDGVAHRALRVRPAQVVSMAAEAAYLLSGRAKHGSDSTVMELVQSLRNARRVAVVAGAVEGGEAVVSSACQLVQALGTIGIDAGIVITAEECNTFGVALLNGMPLDQIPTGSRVAYVVVENDLFRRLPGDEVAAMLANAGAVVTIDHLASPTTERSGVILPATTSVETTGLYVNHEGRAQHSYRLHAPRGEVTPSWQWIGQIAKALGRMAPWLTASEILAQAAHEFPTLGAALVERSRGDHALRVPRQSHRFSGRTAMSAHETLHEPPPPMDRESVLTFSMEGYGAAPASLATRYWLPGWNSQQAINFYQREPGGPLRGGEPGVRLVENSGEPFSPAESPPLHEAWIAVAIYHLFGSEEMSAHSAAIASRTPSPFAAIHRDEGEALDLAEGDLVEITVGEVRRVLPVRFLVMAPKTVAVTAGFGPFTGVPLPAPVQLRRAT